MNFSETPNLSAVEWRKDRDPRTGMEVFVQVADSHDAPIEEAVKRSLEESDRPFPLKGNPRIIFGRGQFAKRAGWERLSPYDPPLDFWWFAGYDGYEWEETHKVWNEVVTESNNLETYARSNKGLTGYVPKVPQVSFGATVPTTTSPYSGISDAELEARIKRAQAAQRP